MAIRPIVDVEDKPQGRNRIDREVSSSLRGLPFSTSNQNVTDPPN
jgi:hypothetical protein